MELTQQIEKLIDQGLYFEARSKAESALKTSPDLRMKQLYALSLSKSGVPEAALEFIEPVYAQFPDDPESAGVLGSICKELFKKNQSTAFAIRSRDTYFKNFSVTKNFYTGINAASMSAMAGQSGRSREIATEVISLLDGASEDFWVLATLGEAHILTKNKAKASECYIRARKLADKDWGKITSVYNQLWLLNHFLPVPDEILKLFNPPGVVAFVGHMIDHPDRPDQRFPAAIEQNVKSAIVHSIRSLNARIGYCSLACGGDILFAEAMTEEGGEVNIFLPFEKADFIKTSVQFAGENWVNRFTSLVERFPVTFISREPYGGVDDIFSFQSKIIFGSAMLRCESYHAEPSLLTVLSDVDLKRQEGGTRDALRLWPFPQRLVNINPGTFISEKQLVTTLVKSEPRHNPGGAERPVLYLVYSDFSGVPPGELEKIYATVTGKSREDLGSHFVPEQKSILGAFEAEPAAKEYLRRLVESMKSSWRQTSFKVSLHAGPVYIEPGEGSANKKLSGSTVQLVKELSALIPNGILASDNFAALLALDNKKFSIDYSGLFISEDGERKTTIYKVAFK